MSTSKTVNELPIDAQLLFLCLLKCITPGATTVKYDVLTKNVFASHNLLYWEFIYLLHNKKLIEFNDVAEQEVILNIIPLQDEKEWILIEDLSNSIHSKIKSNALVLNGLTSVLLGTLAGEATEYMHLKSIEQNIDITTCDASFFTFKKLLERCSLGQVNWLIERSIEEAQHSHDVENHDSILITELCCKYHAQQYRNNYTLEHSPRMPCTPISIVSRVLIHDILGIKSGDHELIGPNAYWMQHPDIAT